MANHVAIESSRAYLLRMNERLPAGIKDGHLSVGWSGAPNLSQGFAWVEFKNVIRDAYPAPYPEGYGGNERALGNAAGSLWRFIQDMQIGDAVLVPAVDGFMVAIVEGPAYFDPEGVVDDSGWRRKACWLTQTPVPRDHAGNLLQRRMKARQTCVDCTDLLDEIRQALSRNKRMSFNDAVLEAAHGAVASCLHNAINDFGLEKVVTKLAQAGGASAEVQAKNVTAEGDIDVLASYDLKIGNQESTINVAYQIKQHEGESDKFGIEQLILRMEQRRDIVRGCFVTTAQTISDDARRMAEDNDIVVLTEKELVEWVLMVGLQSLGE